MTFGLDVAGRLFTYVRADVDLKTAAGWQVLALRRLLFPELLLSV